MSHSPELIDSIRKLLLIDYPDDQYTWIIEKSLFEQKGFMPDICIRLDNEIVCLVEIGYTRPEKLTYYRDVLKVQDVRWYDKEGNLHGDVKRTTVIATVKFEISHTLDHYFVHSRAQCQHCANNNPYDMETEYEEWLWHTLEATSTNIFTDRRVAFIFNYCDQCNIAWLDVNEDEVSPRGILDDIDTMSKGAMKQMWQYKGKRDLAGIKAFAREAHPEIDVSHLDYEDGLFVSHEVFREHRKSIAQLVRSG